MRWGAARHATRRATCHAARGSPGWPTVHASMRVSDIASCVCSATSSSVRRCAKLGGRTCESGGLLCDTTPSPDISRNVVEPQTPRTPKLWRRASANAADPTAAAVCSTVHRGLQWWHASGRGTAAVAAAAAAVDRQRCSVSGCDGHPHRRGTRASARRHLRQAQGLKELGLHVRLFRPFGFIWGSENFPSPQAQSKLRAPSSTD
jgi:hypothetical protein